MLKAFESGLSISKKYFSQIFGNVVVCCLAFWVLIIVSSLVTFGVALIFMIPILQIFWRSMEQVKYYDSFGLRYYYKDNKIVEPTIKEIDMEIERNKDNV